MDKKDAIKTIVKCAALFRENYDGKQLLLVCANNSYSNIAVLETSFDGKNFKHLTGVKFLDGKEMSSDDFYIRCLRNRLSPNDFEMASDGTTEKKLAVLPLILSSGYLAANMIGDYNGSHPALYTEKIAGGIRGCVGFVLDDKLKLYAPNTVLNLDIRDVIKHNLRVIAAYTKYKSEDQYPVAVYYAKKVDWNKVVFPHGFEYLPMPTKNIIV